MTLGKTFLNVNPYIPVHLWVIVSNPTPDDAVVMFNLTSWRKGCDETCLIKANEHPFVKHDSVVAYGRGQLLTRTDWNRLQRLGFCQEHQPLSDVLLKRIQQGALDSEYTNIKLQEIVRNSMS